MGVYISRWKLYGEKILLLPRRNKGLLKHCDAPAPYPSFEGEKGKAKKAKEEVIRAKGRELNADLKIDTIDNPTLPRMLLWHQKPLEIQDGEIVEPIGVRRNQQMQNTVCVIYLTSCMTCQTR